MQLSVMFFVCGFCMLFKILIAEACSANQQSSTNLSGASGKFPSTGKIQYLPVSATCRWTITAPVGQVLRIKIVAIFKAKPCDGEYLRIHDGASEASNKLAEYTCNGGMLFSDEYFFSSNRNLWLEVKTGLITNSTAIEFSYQAHNFQDNRAERAEQARVKKEIRGLQNEMEIRSRAYSLCAEYYRKWKSILFVLLLLVGGLSAGHKALGWKMPQADDLKSTITFIVIFALGVAVFVIQQCYRRMADAHEKHYKAEINCQSIANRARLAFDSSESSSSLRTRYDALLKDKGNSSEIRYEQWAYDRASKK